ncbi:MAG: nucleotidyltransferase [Chloroflexota bacterium]
MRFESNTTGERAMAKTVEEGFRVFLSRLTPLVWESEAAQRHRQSIQACLKSNLGLNEFFRSGSFGNGTSIRGNSDVDYIASIPRDAIPRNSSTFLAKVRNALSRRFLNTRVRVKTPAVVVPFGVNGSETTEVIPAYFVSKSQKDYRIYEIANGAGGWMRTSPDAHNAYVTSVNNRLGNKVKSLIRLLKAWKYSRNVGISSFYLELRTTKYATTEEYIDYSIDVRNVLKMLWDSQLAAMQDPMGISGYIRPCLTEVRKAESLSKLKIALNRAEKAQQAELAGKTAEAFRWWRLLFGRFPSYI